MWDIVFLGFGEAGHAFATGLQPAQFAIAAYDRKLDDPNQSPACRAAMAKVAVTPVDLAGLRHARHVICLVTADQAVHSAQSAAPYLQAGALWFDGNSCSPGTKQRAATAIGAAHYVDLALMAPVYPRLHRTPMLVSGPQAATGAQVFAGFGMQADCVGDQVGQASTIKMLRSVIIKGLEALTAESFLAAQAAGMQSQVIASLQNSDLDIDWAARGAYNLERMLVHGARRSAEMVEVAATLRELGLPDRMAQATALWQSDLAALARGAGPNDLAARSDMILSGLTGRK
jgi:3-hydroxyisobutyrate dehydrogenase-like beta-hydroxyacid dehydrogenase